MPTSAAQPPGWRPDPTGSNSERYWDGNHWTNFRRPPNSAAQAPFTSTPPRWTPSASTTPSPAPWTPPSPSFRNSRSNPSSRNVWIVLGLMATIAAVVLIAVVVSRTSESPRASTAGLDQETTFLAQLERAGIDSSDGGANAVRVAHGICEQLAAGQTPKEAWQWAIANTQLGLAQAVTFTRISMNVYCPQYLSEIGSNGISGSKGLG